MKINEQGVSIPHRYRVRRYRYKDAKGIADDGTVIDFVDARDPQSRADLPHPDYLAVHAAVAGILYMSGAAEAIDKTLDDAQHISVLASDGSTSLIDLFLAHSPAFVSS